jgi:hypothetical protein
MVNVMIYVRILRRFQYREGEAPAEPTRPARSASPRGHASGGRRAKARLGSAGHPLGPSPSRQLTNLIQVDKFIQVVDQQAIILEDSIRFEFVLFSERLQEFQTSFDAWCVRFSA